MKDVVLAILRLIFMGGWGIAVTGWFIGIVEGIGVLGLLPWAFRIGPTAFVSDDVEEIPKWPEFNASGETAHLKYVVIEGNRCLFRRKVALFSCRWRTPLELRGQVLWKESGGCRVTGRYPLGTLLFALGWMVSWTAGGVMMFLEDQLSGLPFVVVGWLLCVVLLAHSRQLEHRRFQEYVVELVSALQGR